MPEDIHVAIKSIGRAGMVTTFGVFPDATVWVPESQAEAYERHYLGRVATVPDERDGNLGRKSNAILDASPSPHTLILDDDLTSLVYFEDGKKQDFNADEVMEVVADGFAVAESLDVRLWGVNQNTDDMSYCTFRPLNLLSPILGPFNGHLEPELRYDESVLGKDDYDFWLQNIQRYHRTLRFNKYHYRNDHGKKPGGFVAIRTMAVEEAGVARMTEKWGDVYQVGGSPGGGNKDRKTNPRGNVLNSMVRVPIAGC